MNSVDLVGRLTKDIDLKYTTNGTAVGTFNLAVNNHFKKDQEDSADFIRCVIWRKSAENLANFTQKGSQIGVEGRIQTRNYENQQGQRVFVTEILVEKFHLLDSKNDQNNGASSGSNNYQGNSQSNNYSNQNHGNYSQNNVRGGTPVDISEDSLPF